MTFFSFSLSLSLSRFLSLLVSSSFPILEPFYHPNLTTDMEGSLQLCVASLYPCDVHNATGITQIHMYDDEAEKKGNHFHEDVVRKLLRSHSNDDRKLKYNLVVRYPTTLDGSVCSVYHATNSLSRLRQTCNVHEQRLTKNQIWRRSQYYGEDQNPYDEKSGITDAEDDDDEVAYRENKIDLARMVFA